MITNHHVRRCTPSDRSVVNLFLSAIKRFHYCFIGGADAEPDFVARTAWSSDQLLRPSFRFSSAARRTLLRKAAPAIFKNS